MDARARDRGPQRHPSDQEDDQGPAPHPAQPAVPPRRDPRERPRRRPAALLPAGPRREGRPSTWPSAVGLWADPCPAGWCGPDPSAAPKPDGFADLSGGSGSQAVSTTMAFARLLRSLVRDPSIGRADRAHRLRRGPDLRPRVADQRGADLRPRRPALHAGRRRTGPPLRRERLGPGAAGGHQRGREPWPPSPPPPPPTPPGASPSSPSTSSTRCSGSSGWATSCGPSGTAGAGGSCSAARPVGPPSTARASSIRTGTRSCWRRRCPAWPPTTPPSPTRWPPSSRTASGG